MVESYLTKLNAGESWRQELEQDEARERDNPALAMPIPTGNFTSMGTMQQLSLDPLL